MRALHACRVRHACFQQASAVLARRGWLPGLSSQRALLRTTCPARHETLDEPAQGSETVLVGVVPEDDDAVMDVGATDLVPPAFEDLPLGARLASRAESGPNELVFETGHLARLADGSCFLRSGDTTVLATAESLNHRGIWRDTNSKLVVDYREKLAGVGRIPGTFSRREIQPRDGEFLASRAVKRAIEPLVPADTYFGQLQVTASVLSATAGSDPEVLAINAASAAIACAGIPWLGPVGAVRVTLDPETGHPTLAAAPLPETGRSSSAPSKAPFLDLVIAATASEQVTMMDVRSDGNLSEETLCNAIRFGTKAAAKLVPAQTQLASAARRGSHSGGSNSDITNSDITNSGTASGTNGPITTTATSTVSSESGSSSSNSTSADPAAAQRVRAMAARPLVAALRDASLGRESRGAALAAVKADTLRALRAAGAVRGESVRVPGSGAVSPRDLDLAFSALVAATLRGLALTDGSRCDGRGLLDARANLCLPRYLPSPVHGSAVVNRGETQVLAAATVCPSSDAPRVEGLLEQGPLKRLFAQLTLPDYGGDDDTEAGIRRELEGARFMERALAPEFPSHDDFPFCLRISVDALAQNGGTAATAATAASLALLDAGLPGSKLVAGICLGMFRQRETDEYEYPDSLYHLQEEQGVGSMMTTRERDGSSLNTAGRRGTGASKTSKGSNGTVNPFSDDALDTTEMELASSTSVTGTGLSSPATYALLVDPQGLELHTGDMTLAIAGPESGISAALLSTQAPGGLPIGAVVRALRLSRAPRLAALAEATASLPAERSSSAPKLGTLRVPPRMVSRVIGQQGSTLRGIEEATGARVQIRDDGTVHIFGASQAAYDLAAARVLDVAGENLQEGEEYTARVVELRDYGAMIELENRSRSRCLLHISEIAVERIRAVEDVLKVGQEIRVLCLGRDASGSHRLSRKELLLKEGTNTDSASLDSLEQITADTEVVAKEPAVRSAGRPHDGNKDAAPSAHHHRRPYTPRKGSGPPSKRHWASNKSQPK